MTSYPKILLVENLASKNHLIFNNKATKTELVAIKAKAMLSKVVGKNHLDPNKNKVEHKWLGLIQMDKIQLSMGRPVIIPF